MIERTAASIGSDFYSNYIKSRIPCIVSEIPQDLQTLSEMKDLTILRELAGSAMVDVEPISNKGTFGTAASKETMSFSIFLKRLQEGAKIYLTTQYTEEEDAAILNQPLVSLHEKLQFTLVPTMAGGMVPAKVNMWLGASSESTSSGLHHDFHDNFYLLLSGEKRFRIFKPSWKACKELKIHGNPHEIFENGLISYNGRLGADGITATTRAQIKVDLRERVLNEAKEQGSNLDAAEVEFDAAMEALLEAKLQSEEVSEEDDFDETEDYENEEGGYEDDTNGEDVSDSPEEVEGEELAGRSDLLEFSTSAKAAQTPDLSPITESSESHTLNMEEGVNDDEEPPSFSSLSTQEVSELLKNDSLNGHEFVLKAGEMLYLPASYFHEVISTSGDDEFHMAINYWFYPPDGQGKPYADQETLDELRSRILKKYPTMHKEDVVTQQKKAKS